MSRIYLVLAFFPLLFPAVGQGQEPAKTVEVAQVPADVEGFLKLRDQLSSTPEGGAAVFMTAFLAYARDAKLGEQFFTIALSRSHLAQGDSYKGFTPGPAFREHLRRVKATPYLAGSYVAGTSWQKNYASSAPYRFQFSRNKYSQVDSDTVKVFVKCSGADTGRPVTLSKNNRGIWKVDEASSVFVGIRAPASSAVDDDI